MDIMIKKIVYYLLENPRIVTIMVAVFFLLYFIGYKIGRLLASLY